MRGSGGLSPGVRASRALLVLGLVVAVGCEPTSHPAVGKWQGGLITLVIYPGGKASLNSIRCNWKRVDASTLQLELTEHDERSVPVSILSDFRLLPGHQGGRAVLNMGGLDWELERERARARDGTGPAD